MTLTLLLDLDDTLLDNNAEHFLPAYFQALSSHLAPHVAPDSMLAALKAGMQSMYANTDPSLTLQQVFDQEFYPRLGVGKEQLQDTLEDFYDRVFRELSAVTKPRPGARELVDWALARGDRVAIATEPLFPRKAIYERIRWAGLDPELFDLISSYETFHFSKSHPTYYAEFLGRLGWPNGPVLMAGNDDQRDLARAHDLGLATYRVDGAVMHVGAPATRRTRRGTLTDLRHWLETIDPATLEPAFTQRDSSLAILTATPAVLRGLFSGLSAAQWKQEPTPDDWSIIELVCHLRDTEREVHQDQIRTILEKTRPFVPRPDAAVWAKQRNYLGEDGHQAIEEFTRARKTTLATLQGLGEEVWQRTARHAIFGPTNFAEVVAFMADHDRLHIQQAWQTLEALV